MYAYLDNSATTRPSQRVIDAMVRAMREDFYNPSSPYKPAMDTEKGMLKCRRRVMDALSVSSGQVIFTSGGTEANNLAILGAVDAMYGKVHAAVTAQEHPSVIEAYEALGRRGHRVSVIPVDIYGQPRFDALEAILGEKPALVSCMQVNNETGAMPDMERLIACVRELAPEALIHVDGVQGFLRVPFDARKVDFYTLSAHKICGPKGIGALWVRAGARLKPMHFGGGQEENLRSGTENTPGIAGLLSAIEEASEIEGIGEKLLDMKRRLWRGILQVAPGAIINGPDVEDGAPHILNVSFDGVRSEVLLHALEAEGVYVSMGSACSSKKQKLSPVLVSMGLPAKRAECALRFSLSPFTTEEEIDYAVEKLGPLYSQLKRYKRR